MADDDSEGDPGATSDTRQKPTTAFAKKETTTHTRINLPAQVRC